MEYIQNNKSDIWNENIFSSLVESKKPFKNNCVDHGYTGCPESQFSNCDFLNPVHGITTH